MRAKENPEFNTREHIIGLRHCWGLVCEQAPDSSERPVEVEVLLPWVVKSAISPATAALSIVGMVWPSQSSPSLCLYLEGFGRGNAGRDSQLRA